MFKKYLLLVTFLVVSIAVFSQLNDFKKPNYKKIEKKIRKKKSDLYYPKLFERYLKSDTSLSLKEKRHLYYGYIFQAGYSPYGISDFKDSLNTIFEKDDLNNKDYNLIIAFADSVLLKNPFDLRALNYQLYALKKLDNKAGFHNKYVKMNIIIKAILSSGDGLTMKTAFYVIYVSHEYDILDIVGFEFGGMQSLIKHYDYLKVADNENNIEGIYFDISPSLNHLNSLFD